MRAITVLLAVCVLVAGPAFAAPLQVFPTKDTGMPGHGAENNSSTGADNADRIAKAYQHTGVYDFDANPATNQALADWLVSMSVNPTVADMVNAINSDTIGVWLRVAQSGTGLTGIAPAVRTVDCAVDWTEGDGTNWTNENWSQGTLAATWTNPNQVLTADGGPLGLGWGLGQNVGFTNASYTQNSVRFQAWDAVSNSYSKCRLDGEIVRQLAAEANNRGLYTWQDWGDPGGAVNGSAYFREQGGTALDPHLLFVPEPVSLTLLGLGGLGVLLRRRR